MQGKQGYFDGYKNERYHDDNLILLVRALADVGELPIFAEELLGGFDTGRLIKARRRRACDVIVEFERLWLCVETKVDSDEGGRWKDQWQSQRVLESLAVDSRKPVERLFVTYGTAEYYTKVKDDGTYGAGAFSTEWKHVHLAQMVDLITTSRGVLRGRGPENETISVWHSWLRMEVAKREQAKQFLSSICDFRERYTGIIEATDYPNSRINISVPEFVFPLYHELANAWNGSDHAVNLGRVVVYPVGRQDRVHDSVLNVFELWQGRARVNHEMTVGGLLTTKHPRAPLYFEMNEDFNLHLKLSGSTDPLDVAHVRKFVVDHGTLEVQGCRGRPENYRQTAEVLYEWDVGTLRHLDDPGRTVEMLARCINKALEVLQ